MEIVCKTYSLTNKRNTQNVTAVLGHFACFHLGHQALLNKGLEIAKNTNTKSVLILIDFPNKHGQIMTLKDKKDYQAAVKEAFKYDNKVLCEEFIEGKELTIPVMEGEAFPPIWIRPKKGFYNYENKYTAGMTEYLLDTGLSASRLKSLKKLAVQVYNACGCRSMARIDFIATDRKFYVIEVNTVPGMTATSLVPKSASKLGISFEEIVKRIAESASLDHK